MHRKRAAEWSGVLRVCTRLLCASSTPRIGLALYLALLTSQGLFAQPPSMMLR